MLEIPWAPAPGPGTPEQRRPILEDMVRFCKRGIARGASAMASPCECTLKERVCWHILESSCAQQDAERAILEEWKSCASGQHHTLDLAVAELKSGMTVPPNEVLSRDRGEVLQSVYIFDWFRSRWS